VAAKNSGPQFSEFVGKTDSPDAIRQEFIDKPLAAAKQTIASTGIEFLGFMSAIPEAFIAAQQRELERVAAVRGDKDKIVTRLQASIEQADRLRSIAEAGQARIVRIAEILGTSGQGSAFHGFVSDTSLNPLAGLTVRIVGLTDAKDTSLSDTTDDKGGFRIPLGARQAPPPAQGAPPPSAPAGPAAAPTTSRAAAGTTGTDQGIEAEVEILDANGKVLYQDPAPLVIRGGSVYREYVLQPAASAASDAARAR
jgi:hypothetical protein